MQIAEFEIERRVAEQKQQCLLEQRNKLELEKIGFAAKMRFESLQLEVSNPSFPY